MIMTFVSRRLLVLALVLSSLSACMLTPTDNQVVCGTNAWITLEGYALNPSEPIIVKWAASPGGPFHTSLQTNAETSPTTINGQNLYHWTVQTKLDGWGRTSSGYELYVAAELPNGTRLVTFDTVNARGQSQYQCLGEQLQMGKSPSEAAVTCGDQDRIVHITAPAASTCPCPTSYSGPIVIDSPQMADYFACLTTLDGDLTVPVGAPSSISMPNLSSVRGNVSLDYAVSSGYWRTIDLSRLASIDGALSIQGRLFRTPLLELGLGQLATVNGNIAIYLNNQYPVPMTVTGLGNLRALAPDFSLRITSLGGFFAQDFLANLDSAGRVDIESLWFDPRQGLPLGAPALHTATDVSVTYPPDLAAQPNARGQLLPGLGTVSSLKVVNDPFYPTHGPDGALLRAFPKLSAADSLWLENTQLSELDLGAAALSIESLTLQRNGALRTLVRPGLAVTGSSGPITITDNPALKQCEAQAFAPGHPRTVSGNNEAPCTCGPLTHQGDLIIDDPVDPTTYSCVSAVTGSLVVGDHVRLDRVIMPRLNSIGRDADLLYTMGDYTKHNDRRVIELPGLVSIGGELMVEADYADAAGALVLAMDNLRTVGGDIDIYTRGKGLSGLPSLQTTAGNVHLSGPSVNTSGNGFAVNLHEVRGTVRLDGFLLFESFFPGVSFIGGNLEVQGVLLKDSFAKLATVSGNVALRPVDLWTTSTFRPFPVLASVGGSVLWGVFDNLDLSLVRTHAGGLVVDDNRAIGALDAELRIIGTGAITIRNNPNLPTCAADAYVAQQRLLGWTGTASVSGNGTGSCP